MRRLSWLTPLIALALVLGMFAAAPAEAQNVTWRGEYYNNSFLQEPSTFVRNDSSIAFNWGLGSPGEGINADNFSVRWTTDVNLAPGNYRFFAQADDNVRVTFNFNTTVLDTFGGGPVGQLVSGDVHVAVNDTYHIQVDYREVSDSAFAFVSFSNLATNPNPPNFPANPGTGTGQWVAYYYPNVNLAGDPAAIVTVGSPNFNTGGGAPVASMPATNWSARFTSVQSLNPGGYRASFNVDDGVRYFVNGALILDRFGAATGQTLTADFTVSAPQTTVQIDYVQFGGEAYLQYGLSPLGGGEIVTPPVTGGPFATAQVTAGKLNVRAQPTVGAPVVTQVRFNEQYPVFGRSADNRWYLIDVFGTFGWASGGYLRIDQPSNVPVVDGSAQVQPPVAPPADGTLIVTATPYAVNVRSGPGTAFRRLATMPSGATATIIGRNADNTWWEVNYAGIVGWATAQYAVIQQNANINSIPVTG